MIQPMSSFQLVFPPYKDVAEVYSLAVNLGRWTQEALDASSMWGSVSKHNPESILHTDSFSITIVSSKTTQKSLPTYILEAQIAGFCRNYGSWGSPKVEFTEWNVELIESMVDTMAPWWESHAERSADTLVELQKTILKLLDGLMSQVRGISGRYLLGNNNCLPTTLTSTTRLSRRTAIC
jgi:hypothetical protein